MCVIIHKPANVSITPEILEACDKANPHGFGLAFYAPRAKRVKVKKGNYHVSKLKSWVSKLQNLELVIHFRWRTHGEICTRLCHPFEITTTDRQVFALFHNGVMASHLENKIPKDHSDTSWFAHLLTRQNLTTAQMLDLLPDLEKWHGTGNRLAIVKPDGTGVYRTGTWHESGGIWYSNLNWQRELPHAKNRVYGQGFYGGDYDWRTPKNRQGKATGKRTWVELWQGQRYLVTQDGSSTTRELLANGYTPSQPSYAPKKPNGFDWHKEWCEGQQPPVTPYTDSAWSAYAKAEEAYIAEKEKETTARANEYRDPGKPFPPYYDWWTAKGYKPPLKPAVWNQYQKERIAYERTELFPSFTDWKPAIAQKDWNNYITARNAWYANKERAKATPEPAPSPPCHAPLIVSGQTEPIVSGTPTEPTKTTEPTRGLTHGNPYRLIDADPPDEPRDDTQDQTIAAQLIAAVVAASKEPKPSTAPIPLPENDWIEDNEKRNGFWREFQEWATLQGIKNPYSGSQDEYEKRKAAFRRWQSEQRNAKPTTYQEPNATPKEPTTIEEPETPKTLMGWIYDKVSQSWRAPTPRRKKVAKPTTTDDACTICGNALLAHEFRTCSRCDAIEAEDESRDYPRIGFHC